MLIFDTNSNPIILDSIHVPTLTDHFWVLDLPMLDFTLAPLVSLEEIVCPTLELLINGFRFHLPANWNILVYDRETAQVDVVPISESAGREFTAFVYGPKQTQPSPSLITIIDYSVESKNVGPLLNKQQMLCHPISATEWVTVSPADAYNKYLKDKTVGDLIS